MTRLASLLRQLTAGLGATDTPGPECPACELHHWGDCDLAPTPGPIRTDWTCRTFDHDPSPIDPGRCLDCGANLTETAA